MDETGGRPLEGITVIDLGQIYNGPYATFMMAMAGARVIKVEPRDGESLRHRTQIGGAALPFAMLNANKEAVTLNLKTPRGRELLIEMARRADVLLENFVPGAMERLGVGYETLRVVNPRLIYASGSGFGRSGPYRNYPAMDITIQAMSGVMSITGFPDGPPTKAGPALCDFSCGTHLYGAVMTALYERSRTGRGRLVEVAMLEAIYFALSSSLGLYFASGDYGGPVTFPQRTGNRHSGLAAAPYSVYPTADGYMAILCANNAHWHCLLRAMERADLMDDARYDTPKKRAERVDEIDALVQAYAARYTRDALFERLLEFRVPCAPVRDLAEVTNDPHLHQRGMLEWMQHPQYGRIAAARSPLRFDGAPQAKLEPSRALGADNEKIYRGWLGLGADEFDTLQRVGVI